MTSTGKQATSPARLVSRIQAGDVTAEAELAERFGPGLHLMLRRRCRDPALAEDLYQETLRLVIEKTRQGEVRQPESLAAFIHGTARNLFIADGRREARYVSAGEDPESSLAAAVPAPKSEPVQLRHLLRQEEARLVRRLLAELRFDRDRELLTRFYLSDEDRDEICEDLEIRPERFNRVIHRARQRLRELWQRSEKRQNVFGRPW